MRGITISIIVCFLLFCIPKNIQASDNQSNNNTTSTPTTKKNSNSRKSDRQNRQEPLDFSGTGRPGQQTAGESRGNCSNTDKSLRAIIPVSNSGKTIAKYPSFWVYFPDDAQKVSHFEFILQNEAREDIWRLRYRVPLRSSIQADSHLGYQNFTLPQTEPPLKTGQWYRWYVKVYCNQVASSQYVQGWVKRVPVSSQLYMELQQNKQQLHLVYGKYGIWYDAVNQLISLYQSQPSNLALEKDWQNLIKAKGVKLEQLPNFGVIYKANQSHKLIW
jgi:hypothetical protein